MHAQRRERVKSQRRAHSWLALLALLLLGCTQQMAEQPRLEPLEESDFFANGMASRDLVTGTVPRGSTRSKIVSHSRYFLTGLSDGQPGDTLPDELLKSFDGDLSKVLARGKERFRVYCVHCHDRSGSGQGMVVQRGFPRPPTFHSPRLRSQSVGHFFRVIAGGRGRMPAHDELVTPADRWAISAYVRALQLSQHAPRALLEPQDIEQLEEKRP